MLKNKNYQKHSLSIVVNTSDFDPIKATKTSLEKPCRFSWPDNPPLYSMGSMWYTFRFSQASLGFFGTSHENNSPLGNVQCSAHDNCLSIFQSSFPGSFNPSEESTLDWYEVGKKEVVSLQLPWFEIPTGAPPEVGVTVPGHHQLQSIIFADWAYQITREMLQLTWRIRFVWLQVSYLH